MTQIRKRDVSKRSMQRLQCKSRPHYLLVAQAVRDSLKRVTKRKYRAYGDGAEAGVDRKRVNEFENKWKMKTNINKFKIIHLDKRDHLPIIIDNTHLPESTGGFLLGLEITRTGYSTHINHPAASVKRDLSKLWSLRELSWQNKKKLYEAFINLPGNTNAQSK